MLQTESARVALSFRVLLAMGRCELWPLRLGDEWSRIADCDIG